MSLTTPKVPRWRVVFERLRDRILCLELQPGDALTEAQIAQDLNVSRTPVREALQRLETEQLVRIIPHKGAVVAGLSEEDIHEIYLIRMGLEGVCARQAARFISPENQKQLDLQLTRAQEMLAAGNTQEASEAADELHRLLLEVGGTPRIRRMIEGFQAMMRLLHEVALGVPGRLERSIHEHVAVAQALRNSDGAEAERLIRQHIQGTKQDVLNAYRNHRRQRAVR